MVHGVRRDRYNVCNRVKWMDSTHVGIAGSFEQDINLGGDSHSSLGGKDAYFGVYNTTAQQWVDSLSIGTTSLMNFRPLRRSQTVRVVGITQGNLSHPCRRWMRPIALQRPGTTPCAPSSPSLMPLSNPLVSLISKSTGNVVAQDIAEISASGKTLITGYFSKDLQWHTSVSSEGGNDLFLVRLDASLEKLYLTTLGGNGSDWGLSLVSIPSGLRWPALQIHANDHRANSVWFFNPLDCTRRPRRH